MTEQLVVGPGEAYVLSGIGINADPADPFHARLIKAVRRVGPGGTQGAFLSALRFEIVQEHLTAGRTFAQTKVAYERAVSRKVVEEMHRERKEGGPRMSLGLAERIAEDDDSIYELKLTYLIAEKREQTMRKFLDAIEGALDNHRTDRADARRGDAAHAQGLTGAA